MIAGPNSEAVIEFEPVGAAVFVAAAANIVAAAVAAVERELVGEGTLTCCPIATWTGVGSCYLLPLLLLVENDHAAPVLLETA